MEELAKYQNLVSTINYIEEFCKERLLNLVIIGSVAYKGLNEKEIYGDLDCIIIYDNLDKIEESPFLNPNFFEVVKESVLSKTVDLFATKLIINDAKVSLDFIGIDYLKNMINSGFRENEVLLRKLTDAEEYPFNDYYNFKGEKYIYEKIKEKKDKYNIYILPKYLKINGDFFSGVLHNKFIHNPNFKVIFNKEILSLHQEILLKYKEFYREKEKIQENLDIIKSIRNWKYFSKESRKFIYKTFNVEEKEKTILITGLNGFIGQYIGKELMKDFKVIGLDIVDNNEKKCDEFYLGDIRDKNLLEEIFSQNKIDIVIHLGAEKALIKCENNKKESYEINYQATMNLYKLSKKYQAKFIFISSDQVFDGKLGNYQEDSFCSPINYYGELKLKVENDLLKEKDKNIAICRTALDFGKIPENQREIFDSVKKNDKLLVQGFIIDHIIYKLNSREKIILPQNEYMSPTSVELIYRQIKEVINKNITGILHCCGGERISRYEFGLKIAKFYNLDSQYISPEDSNDPLRPKDVSLNVEESQKKLGFMFDNIEEMLKKL
ncbi:NAD-dependent epimerase/dehydratase family protein [Fusobacterium nucleatum]|uniref:dTDP-4-dehydrorhamnose reductase n=1 Tax=Fusobacterium nucleatum TaxID=851 RepID=A0A3P1VT08_FUSNU|nr:SDR family oxidoreductase [Fusobacterium nucleatum]RRD37461.1 NAD-dependent epimerase/dehydratase family protein [Fusobacterium nucleatum]